MTPWIVGNFISFGLYLEVDCVAPTQRGMPGSSAPAESMPTESGASQKLASSNTTTRGVPPMNCGPVGELRIARACTT